MADDGGTWTLFNFPETERVALPITNTLYLRASNTSGAPAVFAYSGVKLQ